MALVPARAAGETILVVEDDEDVRAFTADVLGEFGYRVAAAADGVTALAMLERLSSVDLLFTDVELPNGINGRQLAEKARQRRPGLRVLFTHRLCTFVVHRIVCENLPTPESGHWPVARMRHAALDFSTDAIHSPLARIVNGSVRESLTRGGL